MINSDYLVPGVKLNDKGGLFVPPELDIEKKMSWSDYFKGLFSLEGASPGSFLETRELEHAGKVYEVKGWGYSVAEAYQSCNNKLVAIREKIAAYSAQTLPRVECSEGKKTERGSPNRLPDFPGKK